MARILPLRSEVEVNTDEPRVVNLDGEEAEAVFNALSSDTSREIYRALYSEPATASEVAETVETSVQNARYHLDKLQEAGLIDQVDTWYSSRGNEMAVYAATSGALIVSGDRYKRSELRSMFETIMSSLAILAMFSVVAHYAILEYFTEPVSSPDLENTASGESLDAYANVDPDAYTRGAEATPSPAELDFVVAEVMTLPPGVLVFLGGLVVLGVVGTAYYLHQSKAF